MRKIPRILCERYELLDILGKGAHGRIYLAIDLITHDRVAIKLVSNLFRFIYYIYLLYFIDGENKQK
jgi:serine/threonine protein kinase